MSVSHRFLGPAALAPDKQQSRHGKLLKSTQAIRATLRQLANFVARGTLTSHAFGRIRDVLLQRVLTRAERAVIRQSLRRIESTILKPEGIVSALAASHDVQEDRDALLGYLKSLHRRDVLTKAEVEFAREILTEETKRERRHAAAPGVSGDSSDDDYVVLDGAGLAMAAPVPYTPPMVPRSNDDEEDDDDGEEDEAKQESVEEPSAQHPLHGALDVVGPLVGGEDGADEPESPTDSMSSWDVVSGEDEESLDALYGEEFELVEPLSPKAEPETEATPEPDSPLLDMSVDDELEALMATMGDDYTPLDPLKDLYPQSTTSESRETPEQPASVSKWKGCRVRCRSVHEDEAAPYLDVAFWMPPEYPQAPLLFRLGESRHLTESQEKVLGHMLSQKLMALPPGEPMIYELVSFAIEFIVAAHEQTEVGLRKLNSTSLPGLPMTPDMTDFSRTFMVAPSVKRQTVDLMQVQRMLQQSLNVKMAQSNHKYRVVHVENVMQPSVVEAFREQLVAFQQRETMAPTIGFHGTYARGNMDSIARGGLLAPYDFTPTGHMVHPGGTLYGTGVYTSPSFDKADWYAYGDSRGVRQMFVTLVALGKPYHCPAYMPGSNCKPGYDSHVSPDGREYVTFFASQTLPCLLVTYAHEGVKLGAQKNDADPMAVPELSKAEMKLRLERQKSWEKIDVPGLHFKRVPGSTTDWLLAMKRESMERLKRHHDPYNYFSFDDADEATDLHLVFILDRSKSLKRTFKKIILPGCAALQRAINPDTASAVFFGKTVETVSNVAPEFFESSFTRKMEMEGHTNIGKGFAEAMELALRRVEKFRREEEDFALDRLRERIKREEAEAARVRELQAKQRDIALGKGGHRRKKQSKKKKQREQDAEMEEQEEEAVVSERDYARRLNELKKGLRRVKRARALTAFVMMTDGHDNCNTKLALTNIIEHYRKKLTGCNAQTTFHLIGLGRDTDLEATLRMKKAAGTVRLWETETVHLARLVIGLPVMIKLVTQELRDIALGHTVHINVPSTHEALGAGFVRDMTLPTVGELDVRLSHTQPLTLLYRGAPPPRMLINGCQVPVYLDPEPAAPKDLLVALRPMVLDIKAAAVSRRPVQHAIDYLRKIVADTRSARFPLAQLKSGLTPKQRVQHMREAKRLANELGKLVNDLEVTERVANMNTIAQSMWVNDLKGMKFGVRALRRATSQDAKLSMPEIQRGLLALLENEETRIVTRDKLKFKATDARSSTSGMTASEHVAELQLLVADPAWTELSIEDLLYSVGAVGRGIRVQRIEAAVIDPWQIKVRFVSTSHVDTTSAMCALDAGVTLRDEQGHALSDVLVLADPRNPLPAYVWFKSPLHRIYSSVVFTRSPNLYLPSQSPALLMVSLVRCVTQLMDEVHSASAAQPSVVEELDVSKLRLGASPKLRLVELLLVLVWNTRRWLGSMEGENNVWAGLLNKMVSGSEPHLHMLGTSEDRVYSMVRLLALLVATPQAAELFVSEDKEEQRKRVGFAALAESVAREARVQIAMTRQQMEHKLEHNRGRMGGASDSESDTDAEGDGLDFASEFTGGKRASGAVRVSPESAKLKVLCKALNVQPESVVKPQKLGVAELPDVRHSCEFDAAKALKRSSKFFRRQWSNCAPRAVAGCFALAGILHRFEAEEGAGALTRAFENDDSLAQLCFRVLREFEQEGSMGAFLRSVAPGADPAQLQIALYVQGTMYSRASQRRGELPSLLEPRAAIESVAQRTREMIYKQLLRRKRIREAAKSRRDERMSRHERVLQEQATFLLVHSRPPRIFSGREVQDLNEERPANDQLELMPSGLLRHRCCFEECPLFMQDLATEDDRVKGRRTGLYRHLSKLTLQSNRHYINGLHLVAKSIIQSSRISEADFEGELRSRLPKHLKAYMPSHQLTEYARVMYHQYRHIYP